MKAFTLIEALVLILIFSLVLGTVFALIFMFYRNYGYIFNHSIAVDEAKRGVETMVKEIREAKNGDDGSFPIETAGDKEFIFYSDIDLDGEVERVRYFLGGISEQDLEQDCVTFAKGGSCNVSFSDFLSGEIDSAEVKVSIEGDFGWDIEYAEVFADGHYLGNICQGECSDCAGDWQGLSTFDIRDQAADGLIEFFIDTTEQVDAFCDWQQENHSMKAKFEFSFTENLSGVEGNFKKGVIDPVGEPVEYPLGQEAVKILSSYVRNAPPIFEYFDQNGEKILDYPARLIDTKLIKVFLIVDVDVNRDPPAFELESWVQLRNLKTE